MKAKSVNDRPCINCGRPILARPGDNGFYCSRGCYAHHRTRPAADRFWEKVQKTEGCWLWTASADELGYGCFVIRAGKKTLAHRFAWGLVNGTIPDGMNVLHACDNPRCVNPSHLSLGSQTANMADMVSKGRQARGEKKTRTAKLSDQDVRDIRRIFASGKTTITQIAIQFGVSHSQVSRVLAGKSWTHVA